MLSCTICDVVVIAVLSKLECTGIDITYLIHIIFILAFICSYCGHIKVCFLFSKINCQETLWFSAQKVKSANRMFLILLADGQSRCWNQE